MIYHKHVHNVSHILALLSTSLVVLHKFKKKKKTFLSYVLVQKLYPRHGQSSEASPEEAPPGPGVQR